jgi:hypothetical protein
MACLPVRFAGETLVPSTLFAVEVEKRPVSDEWHLGNNAGSPDIERIDGVSISL